MKLVSPTGLGVRGSDRFGSGAYGASRDGGKRKHDGVDFVASPGQIVLMPAEHGTVIRISHPYGDGSPVDVGLHLSVEIAGERLLMWLWYVDPLWTLLEAHAQVVQFQPLGLSVPLQGRYPGITDHVHLRLARGTESVDPTPFLEAV